MLVQLHHVLFLHVSRSDAVLVEDHLKEWYGDKILDRKKHAETKKLHPVDMNAVGGLRFAQMRQKQGDPA